MANANLLLHGLLCLASVALMFLIRRAALDLRTLAPLGAREDLDAFRRTARGLGWMAAALVAALAGAVILGAFWASEWRSASIGRILLTGLFALAGLNVLVAFARATRQQWSPDGSMLGVLRSGLWSVVALGFFALTLWWRFG